MKTKVLHIITRLDKGGSSTNTLETVARLNKEHYEAVLIAGKTFDHEGEVDRFLTEKHISCIFCDDLKRAVHPWCDLKAFFKLYKLIKRGRYDIVHTHSSKAGIVGRWAAWLAGTKYIVHTPHGHVFYGYFNKVVAWIFIIAERLTAFVTHKIITLTKRGKEDHIRYKIAPKEKFVPIYSGIDLSEFKAMKKEEALKKRSEFNIPKESTVIGTVSRLDPVKGVGFLVEAMGVIAKEFPTAMLLLVGDGSEKDALKQKVRELNIEQKVIFTGFRQDVAQMISLMDIFVLSSLNEGMGRVLLEAMACAKPIVATKTGGIPELVSDGKNGFLVPTADSQKLSYAIKILLRNKQQAEHFGQEGQRLVGDIFSIEKMVEKIDNLYQELQTS